MVKKNNENGYKRSWTVIDGEKCWGKNSNGESRSAKTVTVTGQNQKKYCNRKLINLFLSKIL